MSSLCCIRVVMCVFAFISENGSVVANHLSSKNVHVPVLVAQFEGVHSKKKLSKSRNISAHSLADEKYLQTVLL